MAFVAARPGGDRISHDEDPRPRDVIGERGGRARVRGDRRLAGFVAATRRGVRRRVAGRGRRRFARGCFGPSRRGSAIGFGGAVGGVARRCVRSARRRGDVGGARFGFARGASSAVRRRRGRRRWRGRPRASDAEEQGGEQLPRPSKPSHGSITGQIAAVLKASPRDRISSRNGGLHRSRVSVVRRAPGALDGSAVRGRNDPGLRRMLPPVAGGRFAGRGGIARGAARSCVNASRSARRCGRGGRGIPGAPRGVNVLGETARK